MMASSSSGASVGNNKENSEKRDGIEAQDLASLLSMFEEATSSDDLHLPQVVHKTKWNIMKAKSVGSSPAVTPPATPPPTQTNRYGPVGLNNFTKTPPVVINNQNRPIQLTVVKPTAVSSQFSTLSTPAANRNSFTKISTTSLIPPKPKIHIQLKPSNSPQSPSVLTLSTPQQSKATNSSPQISPAGVSTPPVGIIKKAANVSLAATPGSSQQKRVIHIPIRANKNRNLIQTTADQTKILDIDPGDNKLNVIRLPALDAASSLNFSPSATVKQIIPKKRVSTLPSAIHVDKKVKMEIPNSTITSPLSQLPPKLANSLLAAHMTAPIVPIKQELPSVLTLKSNQSPCLLPNSSNESTTQSAVNSNLPNKFAKDMATKNPQFQSETKLQFDEHTYAWSGPCFNNKNSQRIGLSSSVLDVPAPSVDIESVTPVDGDVVQEEVVLEGEVYVDANGNDIFCKDSTNMRQTEISNNEQSNRVVCFETGDKNARRARKYRRRGDMGDSPVREDKSDFFDKIPSYYTALAIPAKQIRKTVFESVSGTVGSQDHLAMPTGIEEQEDEGEYNKVPIHHRIFTNTSEEVGLPALAEPDSDLSKDETSSRGRSSRVRRISTASRHSAHSTSSHRSGSRYSYEGRSSRSRSRSPVHSDHSPVDSRRGRPVSRRRRNSSSQFSASSYSSSCSSGSYCSTCGASLSRSRSRSYSSDGSRERSYSPRSNNSRSRSRSPRGSYRRRRTRSGRSLSADGFRSRSRTPSPFRRRRRNSYRNSSRSRRHQMKDRSSAERRLMESRRQREEDKVKAMEERRVLYVGKLPDNFTKQQLRRRFESFGEILTVRLNFRVHGDNYGFVTFAYACDAFAAKEKGNNMSGQPRFDLCFGGRRRFCPDKYADLDGNREIEEEYAPMPSKSTDELDYAALLKQHVSQQKKRGNR